MEVKKRIIMFIEREGFKPQPFEVCPIFKRCSCDRCPLHKDYINLKPSPEDKERKCKLNKRVRNEIGSYFNLINRGLTLKELSGLRLSIRMKHNPLITRDSTLKPPTNPINKAEVY